ncbi:MAG: metal ABC transporter permease [Solirubrobacteraceae bacterium]
MIPSVSPNPIVDLQALFTFPFMVHALAAGTIVAVLGAIVGWYVALRRQAFAAHTLSVMAFPGATGAALVGLPLSLGYYLACGLAAVALGITGRRSRRSLGADSAAIGTIQTVGLAAGYLFLALNQSILGGPETLLFGTFLGITRGQVFGLLAVAVAALVALAAFARPLLLSSIDRELARARGVPVDMLDIAFVLILGLAIAAVSQLTGALLVLSVVVAPAAAAQQLTMRPAAALALSVVFALAIVWLALAFAYYSIYPVGFYVSSFAFLLYAAARTIRATRGAAVPIRRRTTEAPA